MGLHLFLYRPPGKSSQAMAFMCGLETDTPYTDGHSWTLFLKDWLDNYDRCEACVGELGEKLYGPLGTGKVMTHTTPAVTHISNDDGGMWCGGAVHHYDRAKPLQALKEWCNEPSPCESCRTVLLKMAKGGM